MSDIFDILDKNIDDMKDLPSFKVPDTGIYDLFVVADMKEINGKPAVTVKHTVRAVVELEDDSIPEADRAKPEDSFDVAFILRNDDGALNEFAEGRLKEYVLPFQEKFGIANLKAIITGPLKDGVAIRAKVVKKQRKDDKDKYEARVSEITID